MTILLSYLMSSSAMQAHNKLYNRYAMMYSNWGSSPQDESAEFPWERCMTMTALTSAHD